MSGVTFIKTAMPFFTQSVVFTRTTRVNALNKNKTIIPVGGLWLLQPSWCGSHTHMAYWTSQKETHNKLLLQNVTG